MHPSESPRDNPVEDALHDALGLAFLVSGKAELAARVAEAEGRLDEAHKLHTLARATLQHAEGHLAFLNGFSDTDENVLALSELLAETAVNRVHTWVESARAADQEIIAEWFERVGDALMEAEDALEGGVRERAMPDVGGVAFGFGWSQN